MIVPVSVRPSAEWTRDVCVVCCLIDVRKKGRKHNYHNRADFRRRRRRRAVLFSQGEMLHEPVRPRAHTTTPFTFERVRLDQLPPAMIDADDRAWCGVCVCVIVSGSTGSTLVRLQRTDAAHSANHLHNYKQHLGAMNILGLISRILDNVLFKCTQHAAACGILCCLGVPVRCLNAGTRTHTRTALGINIIHALRRRGCECFSVNFCSHARTHATHFVRTTVRPSDRPPRTVFLRPRICCRC